MLFAKSFLLFVLAIFTCLPTIAIGQIAKLSWEDGVLYSIGPDGRTTVIGSITGFVEQKLPDGSMGMIQTKQISPEFNPIPQENESETIKQQRREIESLQGSAAAMQEAISEHYDFGGAKQLSNDGFVFLIYERELATRLLDLSPTQMERIEELSKVFQRDLDLARKRTSAPTYDKRRGELELAEFLVELKGRLISELSDDVLLARQIRVANLQSPGNSGVIRKIARTPVGSAIGLSVSQQEQISIGVAEISARLQEQIAKARSDVQELLAREMEDSQSERLEELYPGILNQQIHFSSVEKLIRYLDFMARSRKDTATR